MLQHGRTRREGTVVRETLKTDRHQDFACFLHAKLLSKLHSVAIGLVKTFPRGSPTPLSFVRAKVIISIEGGYSRTIEVSFEEGKNDHGSRNPKKSKRGGVLSLGNLPNQLAAVKTSMTIKKGKSLIETLSWEKRRVLQALPKKKEMNESKNGLYLRGKESVSLYNFLQGPILEPIQKPCEDSGWVQGNLDLPSKNKPPDIRGGRNTNPVMTPGLVEDKNSQNMDIVFVP
ncbi:hypothetical protein RJT34_25375 [Clitoria ternatea]|uniref:Uncharacterized protein n=1 Tax=Clitoria ternatea TaxID=43366 RepID=A0AAN9IIF7_CLITE